ncbi:hypothetical protein WDW89_20145 [Deltaproteobacteria bacterium TL4]
MQRIGMLSLAVNLKQEEINESKEKDVRRTLSALAHACRSDGIVVINALLWLPNGKVDREKLISIIDKEG